MQQVLILNPVDYLSILEQLPGNYLILSPEIDNFTILGASDHYCRLTYTTRNNIIGKKLFDVFPDNPNDPESNGVENLRKSLINALETGEQQNMPVQKHDIPDKDKAQFREKYWLSVNTPIIINGVVSYIVHSIEDLSKNRLLKMGQDNLNAITDEVPFMIWRSVNGNCKYVNKVWTEFTGISFEDSLGRGYTKAMHPDDHGEQANLYYEALKSGKPYESKYRLRRKDGEYRWVYNKVSPHFFEGFETEFVGSLIDITDQEIKINAIKESEKQFRQMADSIVQMIWITDANGMHEYYNQRWYDFTGTTYEQTQGEGWNDVFHPDDQQRAWKRWKHSLETGEIYEIEYRLKNAAGEYIWVLGRAAPFYNDEGKIIKWFGTCTDIDAQKLLQQKKDEFISVASHELKTPLTSLKVSVEILEKQMIKDGTANPMMHKMVELANGQVKKLSKLVNDLLNTTNLEQGQLQLTKTKFSLHKLLTNVFLAINAQENEITITGNDHIEIVADEARIEQVLINFINNAIKYGASSKQTIIHVEQLSTSIKISVQDFGQGIFKDKLPYLFDRYYRIGSKGNQYSGLGLGLYISQEIIVKHGGEIGVESEEGKGSTFWFTIPELS